MTETESAIMSKHVAYWTDLLDKDVASGVWPVAEPSGLYGIAVVEALTSRRSEYWLNATR